MQIKCKVVEILENRNVFVSRKYTILKSGNMEKELAKGDLVYGTVQNTIENGVFVRLQTNQIGFAPEQFLERKSDFQKCYYKGRTVSAFIRKNDIEQKKIFLSLTQNSTYN